MSSASTASPVSGGAVPERRPQLAFQPRPPQPKRPRFIAFAVAVAALIAAAYYYASTKASRRHANEVQRTSVPTVTIAVGKIDRVFRLSGVIAAERYAAILAPRLQGGRNDMHLSGNANTVVTMPKSSGTISATSPDTTGSSSS